MSRERGPSLGRHCSHRLVDAFIQLCAAVRPSSEGRESRGGPPGAHSPNRRAEKKYWNLIIYQPLVCVQQEPNVRHNRIPEGQIPEVVAARTSAALGGVRAV